MPDERKPDPLLIEAAAAIRPRAYAPYSGFAVGAALRGSDGRIYQAVNVENAAYPQGICAEAGAIAAMVAAGCTEILEIAVIADSPTPVAPCGGCRQKMREFTKDDALVTMATTRSAAQVTMRMVDLLPAGFDQSAMEQGG
ncbi:cytidine deaminase [Rhodobacteraceae bacterium XHP0102]|nr:cytidine deaminase [Rhodobacteraceae bacterium XHP0102]